MCACLGALIGLFGSAGQILLGEFLDNRIKTRADVRRELVSALSRTRGNTRAAAELLAKAKEATITRVGNPGLRS